jgi:hypothetical protein
MQKQLNLSSVNVNSHYQTVSHASIETHLVEREDIFYTKGRNLAKTVYKDVWNTEDLVDGNDYGIVVACNGEILGNANIQLKKPEKPLKSETFFGESHWNDYFEASNSEIAEISALVVSQDAPAEMRRPIMMMLIVGIQNICRIKGIKMIATVQHDYLIRILTKSLKLPFFQNQVIQEPKSSKLPNDNYWKRVKPPALYYLDPLGNEGTQACYSFLNYLSMTGTQTALYPRLKHNQKVSYASFCKTTETN